MAHEAIKSRVSPLPTLAGRASPLKRKAELFLHTPVRRSPVYLCFVDDDRAERHLSVVPQLADSEALCGQRITVGGRVSWVGAMHMVTCAECRKSGMSFGPPAFSSGNAGIRTPTLQA